MVRDPGTEELMRHDLTHDPGCVAGLSEQAMFGGLCFLMNGNMLCAARAGRAMYRIGKSNDSAALALLGVSPMVHGGKAKGGYVWLDDSHLDNDDIRARLTAWALTNARALPPKE